MGKILACGMRYSAHSTMQACSRVAVGLIIFRYLKFEVMEKSSEYLIQSAQRRA